MKYMWIVMRDETIFIFDDTFDFIRFFTASVELTYSKMKVDISIIPTINRITAEIKLPNGTIHKIIANRYPVIDKTVHF